MTLFAVLGNCQALYVAQCLRFLAPGCQADAHIIYGDPTSASELKDIAKKLASYDYVLTQPQFASNLSALGASGDKQPQVMYYPSIEFAAYHPDLVYISHTPSGAVLESPIGHYHSALAFFCYGIGLTAEQTITKFNESIFARLGYFANSLWASSERNLLASGQATGLPVERYFRSWLRRGCFMYSVNHPKLFVLADLAAGALASCGLKTDPRLCDDYVPAGINVGPVWPVYPEIAARYGLSGCYCFKGFSAGGISPYFSLAEFVEASFAIYRKRKFSDMLCHRIESWKADAALVDYVTGGMVTTPVVDLPESGNADAAATADSRNPLPATDGVSRGLPCKANPGLCFLDWVNSVSTGVQEVSISSREATVFKGWAVDAHSGTVAAGVDVVVDGGPYRAIYGIARKDVAQAINPAFKNSGFEFSLAPGVLSKGTHSFNIRIIASDGRAYYEGSSGRLVVT